MTVVVLGAAHIDTSSLGFIRSLTAHFIPVFINVIIPLAQLLVSVLIRTPNGTRPSHLSKLLSSVVRLHTYHGEL
jgi:hypothetical protein